MHKISHEIIVGRIVVTNSRMQSTVISYSRWYKTISKNDNDQQRPLQFKAS